LQVLHQLTADLRLNAACERATLAVEEEQVFANGQLLQQLLDARLGVGLFLLFQEERLIVTRSTKASKRGRGRRGRGRESDKERGRRMGGGGRRRLIQFKT